MELISATDGALTVRLSLAEAECSHSALREALRLVEDWEFQTLMGCTRHEAEALLLQLRDALVHRG